MFEVNILRKLMDGENVKIMKEANERNEKEIVVLLERSVSTR